MTSFTTVYNRFLGKITDDMYLELTPEDTIRDLRNLLIDALPGFEYPRKDLMNYTINQIEIDEEDIQEDDFVIGLVWGELPESNYTPQKVIVEKSYFAADLTSEEINIIALLMMCGWVQRQVTSIENIRMKYSGSDFKMTSQANHLSKLLALLSETQRQSFHMQRLYKRRELGSNGVYRSTWYQFGDNTVYGK